MLHALILSLSLATPVASPGPPPPPPPNAAPLQVPAGTTVTLVLEEDVASNTHVRGDFFALALAEPISLDGHELVPAGTPVVGQVVHAAKAGGSGKAGELILAARHVDWDGRTLPLRAFRAGSGTGQPRTGAALGVGMVVPLGNFLVRGRNLVMAKGTRVEAKLAQPEEFFPLPPTPGANDAPAAQPAH